MPSTKKKQSQRIAASKKTGKETKSAPVREVIHPELAVHIYSGENSMTAEQAKELLGWMEETEQTPFGNKFLLKLSGKKIRCNNNVTNRPLYQPNVDSIAQDILRRRFVMNGETIIIGKTGLVLNGQHQMVALVAAVELWYENPERYPDWNEEPFIEKLVVVGIDEGDNTVNTMDTCKPRTLADVFYRAPYFKDLPESGHRAAAKMTEHTIKMLWNKTGIHANPFSLRRTHAESVDYLERHKRVLEAVRHIYEEDDDSRKIGKWMSPGYAAAALYLMGTGSSDASTYYEADNPNESLLDFSKWDKACEFFVELTSGEKLKAVHQAIISLTEEGAGSFAERWAILAKAWHAYSEDAPVTAKTVSLKFEVKDDVRHLGENPLMGGIDIGDEGLHYAVSKEQQLVGEEDPTEDEIAERAEAIRNSKGKGSKPVAKAYRKGSTWAKGDAAWCHNFNGPNEPAEMVTVVAAPFDTVTGPEIMVEAFGDLPGMFQVKLEQLSLAQFEIRN